MKHYKNFKKKQNKTKNETTAFISFPDSTYFLIVLMSVSNASSV